MPSFLLASASPRRREILEQFGIPFTVLAPEVDESARDRLSVKSRVVALAEDKAEAAKQKNRDISVRWILAADTLVSIGDPDALVANHQSTPEILGKPMDSLDARRMIERLSGKLHYVHTGLTLFDCEKSSFKSILSESRVSFSRMEPAEIDDYIATGDWEGVAGAYKIQGKAARYIDRIEGSWSGIVGLPIRELYVILHQSAFPFGSSSIAGKRG